MKTNSNTYTIIYAAWLVIIVAFLLAFVSMALKSKQDANVALDKKKQILASLNIRDLSNEQATEAYAKTIKADQILDANGNVADEGQPAGENAGFKLNSADYKAGKYALFVCDVDGATKYVIPVYGMGLWGAIAGYVALDDDRQTVYGVYFNHDSETAGLGAEIKDNRAWQEKFQGKKLFAEGNDDVALAVMKKVDNPASQVEAVTGATLTSDGVSNMLKDCLSKYQNFLKNGNE